MNQFVVSARKYRPSTFKTVIGQSYITTTLQNGIKNNHLAQAFLFCGPRGVGKTTCARILAKTINCENITAETEPCNECESCLSFNDANSLNIYELDAASNNSVDDIRNLTEQVRFAPHKGQFKIYIIDEVHMLSSNAFNAFLKTLEEPPPYAIFILATTEKHKIIPTILSRCQIYDFSRIGIEDITHHLQFVAEKEGVKAEEEALHLIAQKADGALRDSLSIFDQIVSFAGNEITYEKVLANLNILDYDYYFRMCAEILGGKVHATALLFDDILNKGFDGHHFISGLSGHFRNLIMCRSEASISLLEVSASAKEKYKIQSASFQPLQLFRMLEISNQCDMSYKQSRNQRLHIELALMKMCMEILGFTDAEKASEKKNDFPGRNESLASFKSSAKIEAVEIAQTSPVVHAAQENKSEKDKPVLDEVRKAIYEKAEPTKKRPLASILPKTLSINSAPEPKQKEAEIAAIKILEARTPFTIEALNESWLQFAKKMEAEGRKTYHAALTHHQVQLRENFQIILEVNTKADLDSDNRELQSFLQHELKNGGIQVVFILKETEETNAIPYTNSEKFKKMAEKNPDLNRFKDLFKLETGL